MKQVLAELHSLINDLEDQGLTAEASSLQDVFIRVAEEAETDDLANDVKAILESHPVAEVIAEIAKQMGGDSAGAGDEDTQTSSFADVHETDGGEGDATGEAEARRDIISYFRSMRNMQSDNFRNDTERAQAATSKLRKKFPDADPITASEIFGTLNPNGTMRQDVVPFPEQTPKHRERVLEESKKQMEEMDKFYAKYHPYTTAGPQTSR